MGSTVRSEKYVKGLERLVHAVQDLSHAKEIQEIVEIVRHTARELTGADGATFILRDHEQCHYVDEDAVGPLWKGRKFPISACISGWAMIHKEHVAIEDIYKDSRIPHEAYRPTFVKSLAMMPVRKHAPIAAIGNYWATEYKVSEEELLLLQSLADCTSTALENVRLYTELQSSLKETERQLGLRDEFISIAAHELKTPITPIYLQSQILEKLVDKGTFEGNSKEGSLRKFSGTFKHKLGELVRLVDNLLDVSRVRLSQFDCTKEEEVDLSAIALKVVEEFKAVSESEFDLALQSEVKGYWDPQRLTQLVRNLISNAIRYGEGKPIQVRIEGDGSFARLVVEDHGMGIAKEDQARIFERFERASSIKSYGGMGLGLYISSQIVRVHGGEIKVDCDSRASTQFIVTLPKRI